MPRPRSFQVYARFIAQPYGVTITNPTSGQTVTTAAVPVAWSVSGGNQVNYRVRVFSDAALTLTVHDSGYVSSASQAYTIPAGALASAQTYYVVVGITFSGGAAVNATAVSFLTNFPASGNLGTLRAVPIGGCSLDQRILPGIKVTWAQPTLGAGETFVQYDVRRRLGGQSAWTTIAVIDDITVRSYTDYGVASREVYQYSVVYEASVAGGIVTSSPQSPAPVGRVQFDFAYIHAVGDPGTFVRFDGWQVDINVKINVGYLEVWGRQAPTAQVGELDYRTAQLTGHAELLSRLNRWRDTRDLLTAQRADARTLCLRLGRSRELMYGQVNGLKRQGGVSGGMGSQSSAAKMAYATMEMTETYFDEAAAATTITG